MRRMRSPLWTLLLVCLLFIGCEIATVEEPFGELWSWKETKSLAGQWLDANSKPIEIAVVSKGEIRMGQLSWDSEKKEFTAKTDRIQIRRVGTMDFAFLIVNDNATREISFARIRVREDGSVCWQWPDEKQVLDAVRTGKLAGSLQKTEYKDILHPHLTCNGDQMLKWIEEVGEDVVFPKMDDETPMTFRRAEKPKEKSPTKK